MKISDSEWCGDKGALGASCFHTLSDEARDLDKDEWDELRFGQVCTPSATLAEWKAAILKLCKATRACSFQERRLLRRLGEKLDTHDEMIRTVLK